MMPIKYCALAAPQHRATYSLLGIRSTSSNNARSPTAATYHIRAGTNPLNCKSNDVKPQGKSGAHVP